MQKRKEYSFQFTDSDIGFDMISENDMKAYPFSQKLKLITEDPTKR
jgi:hypothetical protein